MLNRDIIFPSIKCPYPNTLGEVTNVSFRRSAKNLPNYESWRLANRSLLRECGIPDELAESQRQWGYVLLHGDDLESGWTTDRMTPAQAKKLLEQLRLDTFDEFGNCLFRELEKRARSIGWFTPKIMQIMPCSETARIFFFGTECRTSIRFRSSANSLAVGLGGERTSVKIGEK